MNLKTIFENLKYSIEFLNDSKDVKKNFQDFINKYNSVCKSMIIFILGHGKNDKLYPSNSENGTHFEEIVNLFENKSCSKFPKIFYFQPCRNQSCKKYVLNKKFYNNLIN